MSSSSSAPQEQYNTTLSGSQLGDLEILANLDDKAFTAMCSSSKHFNKLCTGKTQSQLYQMRVEKRMADYAELLLPYTDPKDPGRWKKIYDAVQEIQKKDLRYLGMDLSDVEDSMKIWKVIMDEYFHDDKLFQLIILDAIYNKLHHGGPKLSFIIARDNTIQLIPGIVKNNSLKILEWLDSLGLLQFALSESPTKFHVLTYIARAGNLPMLKYAYGEGIPLGWRHINTEEEIAYAAEGVANAAVSSGNIEMLNWLADKGLLPGQRGLDVAFSWIQYHPGVMGITPNKLRLIQNWMRNRGIPFNPVIDY